MKNEYSFQELSSNTESDLQRAKRRYKECYIDKHLDHVCSFEWFYEYLTHLWKEKYHKLRSRYL